VINDVGPIKNAPCALFIPLNVSIPGVETLEGLIYPLSINFLILINHDYVNFEILLKEYLNF